MNTFILSWKSNKKEEIKMILENKPIIVYEKTAEEAIVSGGIMLMEELVKIPSLSCKASNTDVGMRILVFQNNELFDEIDNIQAHPIKMT